MKLLFVIGLSVLLGACTGSGETPDQPATKIVNLEPTQADIDYADMASPSDTALASLYDRSCISCHSMEGAGAPLTGHAADWEARLAVRGLEGLLQSTIEGRDAMPAMGLCMDCSDEDFIELIKYMGRKE